MPAVKDPAVTPRIDHRHRCHRCPLDSRQLTGSAKRAALDFRDRLDRTPWQRRFHAAFSTGNVIPHYPTETDLSLLASGRHAFECRDYRYGRGHGSGPQRPDRCHHRHRTRHFGGDRSIPRLRTALARRIQRAVNEALDAGRHLAGTGASRLFSWLVLYRMRRAMADYSMGGGLTPSPRGKRQVYRTFKTRAWRKPLETRDRPTPLLCSAQLG